MDLLLIGAEGGGLAPEVIAECQEQVTIPQAGVTESLNVAVASGIVLAEWKRQEALGLLAE
jgi:tRNA G18 (ribose-2'-O)-methylase SpoU